MEGLLTRWQQVILLNYYPSGLLTPQQARCLKEIGLLTPGGAQSCFIGCGSREGQSHFAVQLGHWKKKKRLVARIHIISFLQGAVSEGENRESR